MASSEPDTMLDSASEAPSDAGLLEAMSDHAPVTDAPAPAHAVADEHSAASNAHGGAQGPAQGAAQRLEPGAASGAGAPADDGAGAAPDCDKTDHERCIEARPVDLPALQGLLDMAHHKRCTRCTLPLSSVLAFKARCVWRRSCMC